MFCTKTENDEENTSISSFCCFPKSIRKVCIAQSLSVCWKSDRESQESYWWSEQTCKTGDKKNLEVWESEKMCWKLNQESLESCWWSESRYPPDIMVKKMISLTNIINTDNKEKLRRLRKWKDPKKHRLYQLLWVLIEDRLSRKMVLETVENEKNGIICDQENIACKKSEDINTFQRWKTTSMPWFRLIQKSGIHFLARVSKWAISFPKLAFVL